MAKPPQPMLDKLFFNWCYLQAITYIIVTNLVHSCVTVNPSQHTTKLQIFTFGHFSHRQLLSKYSYSNIDLQVYSKLSNLFLLPPPMSISILLYLSSYYQLGLGLHNALVPLEVFFGHSQTTSTDVGQAFLQLVLPLGDHVYHRSELGPFQCDRKSIATYTFLQHSVVEHVVFLQVNCRCFE